jgi:hypothetical protein
MNGEGTAVVSDVRKRRLVAFSAETGKEVSIHEITGDGKVIEGTTISGTFYGAHKF